MGSTLTTIIGSLGATLIFGIFMGSFYIAVQMITKAYYNRKRKKKNASHTSMPNSIMQPAQKDKDDKKDKNDHAKFTVRAEDGTMHMNTEYFFSSLEEDAFGIAPKMAKIEEIAQKVTDLSCEKVKSDIAEWLGKQFTSEFMKEIPEGTPKYNTYYRYSDKSSPWPNKTRFAIVDGRENWIEKYHPFLKAHASDPILSAEQLERYADLSSYCMREYLCVDGYVYSGELSWMTNNYYESTDGITAVYSRHDSAHDGADYDDVVFEISVAIPPKSYGVPLPKHSGLPECEKAYRKDNGALLYRPFGLDGWYTLNYHKESGNGWDGSWKSHNMVTGEVNSSEK